MCQRTMRSVLKRLPTPFPTPFPTQAHLKTTHNHPLTLEKSLKEYMLAGKSGHVTDNQRIRLTGAGLFVDYLCGIAPKKKTSHTSYLKYPDEPWPFDYREGINQSNLLPPN